MQLNMVDGCEVVSRPYLIFHPPLSIIHVVDVEVLSVDFFAG